MLQDAGFLQDYGFFVLTGKYLRRAMDKAKATGEIRSEDFRGVAAGLCPTLDVKVLVKIGSEEPTVLVAPEDWQTVGAGSLLDRLYPETFMRPSAGSLLLTDLRENSGALMGRLSHSDSLHAVITHGGLRNGSLPNLAGLVLGHNNSDLARSHARPLASREAWQRWAEQWIDSQTTPRTNVLADLHPLCPGRDLAVYRLGDKQLDETQLLAWVEQQSDVRALHGMPSREDYDDVSDRAFDNFRVSPEIIVLPSTTGELAKSLSLQRLNYEQRLEVVLRKAWGKFEALDEHDACVGVVDGVEITRSVIYYKQ